MVGPVKGAEPPMKRLMKDCARRCPNGDFRRGCSPPRYDGVVLFRMAEASTAMTGSHADRFVHGCTQPAPYCPVSALGLEQFVLAASSVQGDRVGAVNVHSVADRTRQQTHTSPKGHQHQTLGP